MEHKTGTRLDSFHDLVLSDTEMIVLKGGANSQGGVNSGCHCNCDLSHLGCNGNHSEEISNYPNPNPNSGCHCSCTYPTPTKPAPTMGPTPEIPI